MDYDMNNEINKIKNSSAVKILAIAIPLLLHLYYSELTPDFANVENFKNNAGSIGSRYSAIAKKLKQVKEEYPSELSEIQKINADTAELIRIGVRNGTYLEFSRRSRGVRDTLGLGIALQSKKIKSIQKELQEALNTGKDIESELQKKFPGEHMIEYYRKQLEKASDKLKAYII